MRKFMVLALVLALALVIAACGNKPSVEGTTTGSNVSGTEQNNEQPAGETPGVEEATELIITHDLDTTTVKVNPSNVVVFDFGVLDTLDKLGVEVLGVAQNSIPPYLAKYEGSDYKNIGSLKEPDFEAIHAMKPELIIISGRQSDLYSELKDIAPTIFMGVDNSNYMASFAHNVRLLGEIFNKEAEVEQELAAIQTAIEGIQDLTSANDNKGLVTLVTGGKVSAYGPGSRFGLVHDVFGVKPADEGIEVSTHGMSVSFEYIAEVNPDYLFVVDRDAVVEGGDSPAKDVIENVLVQNTNAYKEGRIIYLDPNYWYLSGGGLVSVSEMVREVTEGLQ